MDTLTAAVVLALTTISFALLAERQRRRADAAQAQLAQVVDDNVRLMTQKQQAWADGYNTGLIEGNRRGVAESGLSFQKGHDAGWAAAVEALETCRELPASAAKAA